MSISDNFLRVLHPAGITLPILLLLSGCDSTPRAERYPERITESPDTTHDSLTLPPETSGFGSSDEREIIFPNGSVDIERFVDTGINGIVYGDGSAVREKLGENITMILDTIIEPDEHDFPRIQVLNADRSQFLTLYKYPGDGSYQIRLSRIRYLNARRRFIAPPHIVEDAEFVSARGVRLGMKKNDIIAMFGKPSESSTERGLLKLSYQEKGGLYFGDYWFRNGRLTMFEFGSIYP